MMIRELLPWALIDYQLMTNGGNNHFGFDYYNHKRITPLHLQCKTYSTRNETEHLCFPLLLTNKSYINLILATLVNMLFD